MSFLKFRELTDLLKITEFQTYSANPELPLLTTLDEGKVKMQIPKSLPTLPISWTCLDSTKLVFDVFIKLRKMVNHCAHCYFFNSIRGR